MTLLFVDGFADGLNEKKWSNYNSLGSIAWGTSYGRGGASGVRFYNAGPFLRKQVAAADEHATLIVGGAYRFVTAGGRTDFLNFMSDDGATDHVSIQRDVATGKLYANLPSGNTAMLGPSVALNTWYYIEAKVTLSDSVGAVEIRLNGSTVISLTGIDTKRGGTKTVLDTVKVGWAYNVDGTEAHVADFYIANGAGSVNNDFLGEIVVETLLPTGNGAESDLVGSDADSVDNYALVNETTPDLVTYVGSAVTGDRDLYAMANLVRTSGSVRGVQVAGYVEKSDASGVSCKLPVARSGTVSSGAALPISAAVGAAEVLTRVVETDPVTAAPFTIANVNALEAGFEVA